MKRIALPGRVGGEDAWMLWQLGREAGAGSEAGRPLPDYGGSTERPALPPDLPILPLQNLVVFPVAVFPLAVVEPRAVKLVDDAVLGSRLIGLVTTRPSTGEQPAGEGSTGEATGALVATEQLYRVGTLAMVHKLLKLPDGSLRIAVQGLERIRILEYTATEPYLRARAERAPETVEDDIEVEALMRNLMGLFQKIASLVPQMSEELQTLVLNIDDPRQLSYVLAASIRMDLEERQAILEEDSVKAKLRRLTGLLSKEMEVLELGQQIQSQVQTEMTKAQREYVLREQMKAIRQELGEADEAQLEVERLRKALEEANLPVEAKEQADRELDRLTSMPPAAAEYGVIRTYLEWLASLPWSKGTEDRLDITGAQQVLDEDHYDLEKVKGRILEFLAVRQLRLQRGQEREEKEEKKDEVTAEEVRPVIAGKGAILCFIGPPGVGKTSLGRSIARAMGRKFIRISLGGVHDEAEIRGHRRTYIGAMPGTILQAIRRVGSNNPIFMMDEVDKVGADFRGDPASALLEVLDPEQNREFRDHYLDVAFDLSKVFFITTANVLETISPPLRDRMEIIRLAGYSDEEKYHIARRYLVPRQMEENTLTEGDITITDESIRLLISDYTREAGVRNLEREIGSLCRKVAREVAAGAAGPIIVDEALVRKYLGPRRFYAEVAERTEVPGVATGLAVTPMGGEIIFIEATQMPGDKQLMLTGQLGDVMRESAQAALSYVRSQAQALGLPVDFYDHVDVHVHIPEGAQPKDGPSAGVALATALASLFTARPVRDDVAMTGEITLRGRVLPVGGIKEKVLAARRAGIKTVILPRHNQAELEEDVPAEQRQDLEFIFADTVDQVWAAALRDSQGAKRPP